MTTKRNITIFIFNTGPATREPDELGCVVLLISALDQELTQIDWLPISRRLISLLEAALCLHVWLLEEAFPSHLHVQ